MNDSKLTNGVAIILTGAFLIASGWLLQHFATGDAAQAWDHAVVVYNALTSVGFTAVGVLLGTKVQQVNVEKATATATAAKADADRKTSSIQTALTHLDAPVAGVADEAGGGTGSVATAKQVLRLALS